MENDYQDTLETLQSEIESLSALITQLESKLAEVCSQMENIKYDV